MTVNLFHHNSHNRAHSIFNRYFVFGCRLSRLVHLSRPSLMSPISSLLLEHGFNDYYGFN